MAKKMKRILALVLALALCAGQVAVPAMAAEAEAAAQQINIVAEVSQIPAASANMEVTAGATVETTTANPETGTTTATTSTTTTWEGTNDNGAAVNGSETLTESVVTDNYTGVKLEESGTIQGSETTEKVTSTTESESQTIVTGQTEIQGEKESITGIRVENSFDTETSVTTGEWENGNAENGGLTEGEYVKTGIEEDIATDTTINLGEEEIPEEGITIELKPNTNGTFSGEANGSEVTFDIPEGAEPILENGKVIGYRIDSEEVYITDITTNTGAAQKGETIIDKTPDTQVVTPDLSSVGITIGDNTRINEVYGDAANPDKVTAYIVTNETETTEIREGSMEAMERPVDGIYVRENGITETITTEDVLDENGNLIGFAYTSILTDAGGLEIQNQTVVQTVIRNDLPEAADPTETITLPEKPAEVNTTDADGITTVTTVAELRNDKGEVIGYETITVKTDAEGMEISRSGEKLYGTVTRTEETVTTDKTDVKESYSVTTRTVEQARVTAEQSVYQDIVTYTRLTSIVNSMTTERDYEVVTIDGKLYYIYTGEMTVTEGEGHGDTSLMQPITPDPNLMKKDDDKDLAQGGSNTVNNTNSPQEGFKYIGYGVNTAININKGNSGSDVTQFRLKSSDGKVYYALCIDFNTTIKNGHLYDIADITSEDYYQQSGSLDIASAEKIRSVALNGYWGTTSDVGSMEDVQEFLTEYLTGTRGMTDAEAKKIVDSLTPGQALAATQAALWKFGNKDKNNTVNENNLVPNNNGVDETNTKYLFDALLAAANDPNATLEADEGVEFLDAEDITAGAITINSVVIPENADTAAPAVYNTDLSFTLGIEPSKLNGDLIVTVNVGGEEVKKVRLAGADNPLLPMGRIVKNEDGSYTIPDVEIAEGVSINLNLSGTQDLGTGVYIYTSLEGDFNDSQTLVTLATGSRKVNLDMNMNFTVTEPTATVHNGGETEYGTRTDLRTDTRTDTITRTETKTAASVTQREYEASESFAAYSADVTVSKVTTTKEKTQRSWMESWLKVFEKETDEHNDDFGGEEKEKKNVILDEEVPLADAPQTGDISGLWAAISLISLSGAALLSKKREEA